MSIDNRFTIDTKRIAKNVDTITQTNIEKMKEISNKVSNIRFGFKNEHQ